MDVLPPLNEEELSLIVRHLIDSEEEMTEAVVNAFLAGGLEVTDRPTSLVDWIGADIFESLQWSSGRPLYLCTRIWDHLVLVTPDEVQLYTTQGDS